MHHHINHCWCSESNHDDDSFYARNMVDINKLEQDEDDWDTLIETTRVLSQEQLMINRRLIEKYPDVYNEKQLNESSAYVDCPSLKPEVVEWLNENIKPSKDGSPGWAMGNEQYRIKQGYSLVLWFTRHPDARKFIKRWSSFGKATSYFDYFKSPVINLVLDTETMKYRNRHEDSE
jgi:hypothetical protein